MHSISRGQGKPKYTRAEFKEYSLLDDSFWQLYRDWVINSYAKDFLPSCDRLNNNLGYSFNNIQFISWREHLIKTGVEHKKGFIVGKLKPVIQFTLEGEFIKKFISSYDACRKTGVHPPNIRKVCRGDRPHAGGYKWEYVS